MSIMLEKQLLSFQTVSLDTENLRVDFCHQDPPLANDSHETGSLVFVCSYLLSLLPSFHLKPMKQ